MQKINREQLFSKYPNYPNFDEIINADLIIMPDYGNAFNGWQQDIFRILKTDNGYNVNIFSEEQDKIRVHYEFSAPEPILIVNLGLLIVNSIRLLYDLKKALKKEYPDKTFKIKHAIYKNGCYEMMEFEGNINDYEKALEQLKSQ